MKDYEHIILWLDYFNKHLSKRKGRKVKRDHAVFDPTMTELIDAAKLVGYNPTTEDTNDKARYPRRSFVRSGYIMLPKLEDAKKSAIITTIAEKMSQKRNKQKISQR
ncbi:MAG TPA: signal recognition particle subunit SRP19/SEC65 family protein [Nitrososphaeraceae archaeon]|nr:signal recognition particle subunit SRP19/SEC65 family protein [Nitrososphaeraceae archaeon]